jgi:hypothetical protein
MWQKRKKKKRPRSFHLSILQQNQIVWWCDTRFTVLFPCLPPSPWNVRHLQYLMLCEWYLIRILWIRVVGVDGFCSVWIFCGCRNFWIWWSALTLWLRCSRWTGCQSRNRRRCVPVCRLPVIWTSLTRYWRARFESVELCTGVHLRSMVTAGASVGSISSMVGGR